jgi:hypothetical protein
MVENQMTTRESLLNDLNETISHLLDICQAIRDPNSLVYEGWTVKDVLSHLTFWHESFARNASDLVKGLKPKPLRGKYSLLNERCFAEFRSLTMEEVITRFKKAHAVIQESVLDDKLKFIPYRVGSRDYPPDEHLKIVNDHIKEHTNDIKKVFTGLK